MSSIPPTTGGPAKEAVKHGMGLDPENRRVQCCYCGKVVPGFNRLQHHLGWVRGNIAECPEVPEEVKTYFKDSLVAVKVGRLEKEVGDLDLPVPSSKRQCIPPNGASQKSRPHIQNPKLLTKLPSISNGESNVQKPGMLTNLLCASNGEPNVQKPVILAKLLSARNGKSNDQKAGMSAKLLSASNGESNVQKPGVLAKSLSASNGESNVQKPGVVAKSLSDSNGKSNALRACSIKDPKEGQSLATIASKRYIGRFFFENGIDFSAVKSSTFRTMMEIFPNKGEGMIHCIPSVDELKGWVLEDELNDIENYVKKVRMSWAKTGCSVLLDGWTDKFGRDIVNVVVDCPEGPIFLRSAKVSPSKGANALQLFLESVLEEVGIQNVVQIVAHTWSESLEVVCEEFIDKYPSLFWTVSGTYCLSLILDMISNSDPIKDTLEKAKFITQFFYSCSEALTLLRRNINGHDLLRPSKIKTATPFLTLEKFLVEKTRLEQMVTSPDWLESRWASTNEGKMITGLIGDYNFWDDVLTAMRTCIPLVKAMSLINGDGKPQIGYIYETMDQIKEMIREELDGRKSRYTQYWEMIDEVWNTILHSPLHAAAHLLNPRLYFAKGFVIDTEVAAGVLITIVRMCQGRGNQATAWKQANLYAEHHRDFQPGIDNKDSLHPAAWWAEYGDHCPQLQRIAIKALSQTCNGPEMYQLNRDLAEKLLSDTARNPIEQQKLLNFTYLHYNMKLMQYKHQSKFSIVADEIDPTDDWITNPVVPQSVSLIGSGQSKSEVGGPSVVRPRMKPNRKPNA